MYPIKDYFLIGDLHTAALVSKNGSIDWLCVPHFDSPSVFASLLDKKAGTFAVEAVGFFSEAKYKRDTAIVETVFRDDNKEFSVTDFMLPQPKEECGSHFLVRKITGIKGNSAVKLLFDPKPNYAKEQAEIKRGNNSFKVEIGPHTLWMHIPEDIDLDDFEIKEGETKQFILEYSLDSGSRYDNRNFEEETETFWKDWIKKGTFFDFCREELIRSAITLKLMQFYPTGAIIAAPTTSLPETIGGVRNWDYRYVWVRDATFTLYAFYILGYTEEAERFFEFIEKVAKECEECNIEINLFYTIEGKRVPREEALPHLAGYQNSAPVRVGNDARDQFQLDVYGSLIDAHYFMSKRGLKQSPAIREIILDTVGKIKERWMRRDNGIWEIRGSQQHYTYSKVMAWLGVDRAIRLCKELDISDAKRKEFETLEKEIRDWIWKNCFDEETKAFKQHPETQKQDATNLLFVMLQFLDRHDPRTRTIIKNTCKKLTYKDIYVYRYHIDDGLEGEEGAFLLCSFWLISALAMIEELGEAEELFRGVEKIISLNGLLPEEIDPDTHEYLGNYPQAFSHIGFIMSAFYLNKYKNRSTSKH